MEGNTNKRPQFNDEYWERMRHRIAANAMIGRASHYSFLHKGLIARECVSLADALIEELKQQ